MRCLRSQVNHYYAGHDMTREQRLKGKRYMARKSRRSGLTLGICGHKPAQRRQYRESGAEEAAHSGDDHHEGWTRGGLKRHKGTVRSSVACRCGDFAARIRRQRPKRSSDKKVAVNRASSRPRN